MGVNMEFFRMAMYLTFPAILFYLSNRPALFEKGVTAHFEKENSMRRVPSREAIEERVAQIREFKRQKAQELKNDWYSCSAKMFPSNINFCTLVPVLADLKNGYRAINCRTASACRRAHVNIPSAYWHTYTCRRVQKLYKHVWKPWNYQGCKFFLQLSCRYDVPAYFCQCHLCLFGKADSLNMSNYDTVIKCPVVCVHVAVLLWLLLLGWFSMCVVWFTL